MTDVVECNYFPVFSGGEKSEVSSLNFLGSPIPGSLGVSKAPDDSFFSEACQCFAPNSLHPRAAPSISSSHTTVLSHKKKRPIFAPYVNFFNVEDHESMSSS